MSGKNFRAWDVEAKCYIKDPILVDNFGNVYVVCEESSAVQGTCLITGKPNVILEQDTGLKDKNGKKICEGDIVKVVRSYGYGFLPKGAKAKIEFDEKELCYKLRGQGDFRLTAKKELEVIGNIHSNPELLDAKKEG